MTGYHEGSVQSKDCVSEQRSEESDMRPFASLKVTPKGVHLVSIDLASLWEARSGCFQGWRCTRGIKDALEHKSRIKVIVEEDLALCDFLAVSTDFTLESIAKVRTTAQKCS